MFGCRIETFKSASKKMQKIVLKLDDALFNSISLISCTNGFAKFATYFEQKNDFLGITQWYKIYGLTWKWVSLVIL